MKRLSELWDSFYMVFIMLVAYGFTVWGLQNFLMGVY